MKPPRQCLNHLGDTQCLPLIVLELNYWIRLSASWKNIGYAVEAYGRPPHRAGGREAGVRAEKWNRRVPLKAKGIQPRTACVRNRMRVSP